jgi:P-type Ca2+ transporter type 2C
MPPPRASGMGERKKRTMSALPLGSSVASTSSSQHRQYYQAPQRSPSPPASAYFPLLSADSSSARLQPTPDAQSHFAYSTTLRRHQSEAAALTSPAYIADVVNQEATSLWSRAVGAVTGQPVQHEYQRVESSRTEPQSPQQPKKDTASARFAHTSVEVRH